MVQAERSHRQNIYREFQPGQQLSFTLKSLDSDGAVRIREETIEIGKVVRSSGFFGSVIIPHFTEEEREKFVLKTTQPGNPIRHLFRLANWEFYQFPDQESELVAQLTYLSTRMLHLTLPKFSKVELDKQIYSPDSPGYTLLPTGYTQAIEFVEGRGPRYDHGFDEYEQFKRKQREGTDLLTRLGFELAGQIHPDNPVGLPNLWWDGKNDRWIMMDTIAAFQMKALQPGNIRLPFQRDMQKRFNTSMPFNRVHTDRLLREIGKNADLFTREEQNEIVDYIHTYNRLWRRKEHEVRRAKPLESKTPTGLTYESVWGGEMPQDGMLQPDKVAIIPAVKETGALALSSVVKFPSNVIRAMINAYNDPHLISLSGINMALEKGYISTQEYEEAIEQYNSTAEKHPYTARMLKWLVPYYIGTSAAWNTVQLPTLGYIAATSENFLINPSFWIAIGVPGMTRFVGTIAIGALNKKNSLLPAAVSLVPALGHALGVFTQISLDYSEQPEAIKRWTERQTAERLSVLGTNTDAEAFAVRVVQAPSEAASQAKNFATYLKARLNIK